MVETLAFINARLQGAHNLLHATHDYVKWQAPLDVKRMDPSQTFKISCEAMRVTVRMTQIIAWLILQKAVLEGDLTQDEFLSEEYRVLRGKHCLESYTEEDVEIPPRLRELLKESRELYLRTLQLDKVTRHGHVSLTKQEKRRTPPSPV